MNKLQAAYEAGFKTGIATQATQKDYALPSPDMLREAGQEIETVIGRAIESIEEVLYGKYKGLLQTVAEATEFETDFKQVNKDTTDAIRALRLAKGSYGWGLHKAALEIDPERQRKLNIREDWKPD